jgi:5'-3' exonuclease
MSRWDCFYLDAPSLVYRAFFAWPQTITDPTGRPVNAVRGFMEMVTRLITDHRPGRIVAVFDENWRPSFRVAAWPGYKSQRPDEPEEITTQVEVLGEVLAAAGITYADSEDLEADDVLATYIQNKPPDETAAVVTGDRDLLCLVRDPDVTLLFPLKGVVQLQQFDERGVEEKYGVPPRLYQDFATMRGDSSDGLPGVVGIGPKRAAELLERFGSLDEILASLDQLQPGMAKAFESARDYISAMRTVVGLVRDAPIRATDPHAPDPDALSALAFKYNLGSSATRLGQALAGQR